MYLNKIRLINVRCFVDETIDLVSSKGVNKWLVILGDNGTGKTTILRSIAMGICDETGAAGLLQDTSGDWIQWGEKEAKIVTEFWNRNNKFTIETTISKTDSGVETVSQSTNPDVNFPWKDIFTCGYGANRSIMGSRSTTDPYSLADALYSLFNYRWDLYSPELMLRRYAETKKEQKEICSWLDEVLMLEKGSTSVDFDGISISKKSKENKAYLGSLADGHVATITVVLDMLGWALLAKKKGKKNKLSGIILIDELEQHLHPSWQKYIVKLLNEVFPNLQFISTTHSPLCAIGTANLKNAEEKCSLVLLTQNEKQVRIQDKIKPPCGQRADQVLTSHLFGLETTRSDDTQTEIEKYSRLASKEKRTNSEEVEFKKLYSKLNKKFDSPGTELERFVESAVKKAMEDFIVSLPKDKLPSNIAVDFEIKRQLKELFGTGEEND